MPRYFFDLHNDVDAPDEEGSELPDLDAAKEHALLEAREMIKASIDETGRVDLRHRIEIRDDAGAIVHTVQFQDAMTVQRGDEVLN